MMTYASSFFSLRYQSIPLPPLCAGIHPNLNSQKPAAATCLHARLVFRYTHSCITSQTGWSTVFTARLLAGHVSELTNWVIS